MQTFNNFADLGKSFAQMKLQDELDAITDQSIMGLCIKAARMNKKPLHEIAATILCAYEDNPVATLNVVGDEAMRLIRSIYG